MTLESEDSGELARFGYAQDLAREMGGFSNFATSFSIISVLTGCLTTYGDAIGPGGPLSLGLGWPLVVAGTLLVALAMAELASALPTAGALYHWSSLLGGPGWGWFTAMMNLVGQVAIVAAIDLGCARELGAALGLSEGYAVHLFFGILLSHVLLNGAGVRLIAKLNDLSAFVHLAGVLVIVTGLFIWGKTQPVSFLFQSGTTTRSDHNVTLGFLNALLLSMYTFTGYDASAHLSEETTHPSRRVPLGILSAVMVSAVAGYLLLAALTLAIPDAQAIGKDEHPALTILGHAFGPRLGRAAMAAAIVAMWFCGLSSLTSASRTLWAFARDGGVPWSAHFSKVHRRFLTPVAALLGIGVLSSSLVLIGTALSTRAFQLATQVATAGLYVSYGLPILLSVIARRRGTFTLRGEFSLGRWSTFIGWAATIWTVFVLVVCVLPPNLPALVVLGTWICVLLVAWFAYIRRRFSGPKVTLSSIDSLPTDR